MKNRNMHIISNSWSSNNRHQAEGRVYGLTKS